MFVTVNMLAEQYGVHDVTAKFFVDREPPKNNLYWHDRLLYLKPNPGFLIIPVLVDTLNKMKISRSVLLTNEYIQLLEQFSHIAALEEIEKITEMQAIEMCKELVKPKVKNIFCFNTLVQYFNGDKENFIAKLATPYKALHRADFFLFALVVLDFSDDDAQKIVTNCCAVMRSFLMLDDADDIEADLKTNDPNCFHEAGLNKAGYEKIKELLRQLLDTLKTFNRTLARTVDVQLIEISKQPEMQKYITT